MMSRRVVSVDRERCVTCGACGKACPRAAISVYRGCYARVNVDLCVGCGKCAKVCPVGCVELTEREER